MKNGNGMHRIVSRWVVAVAGTLALAALMLPPPPAAAIVPDTPCNEKCLADYTAAAVKCTEFKNNEAAHNTCNDAAHERYLKCRSACQTLGKCEEKCWDAHNEGMKKCDKVKDKVKKAKCKQAVMEQLATCLAKCRKKKDE